MKTKIRIFIVIPALVIMIGLGACTTLQQLVKKPTLEFQGLNMKDMSLFEGTLVFHYSVSNPNPIGIPLDQIAYQVKIDGKNLINGDLDKKINIPGNGKSNIEIPVHIRYLDFFGSIVDFVHKDVIEYDLSGSIGKFGMKIPFQRKGTFPVPELPQISLNRIDIDSISLMGASLVFVLDMVNKNDFPVALDGLDYSIKLGNSKLAIGEARSVNSLKEKGTSTLELPIHLNFLKLGQAAYELFTKSSSAYELTGNMKFQVPQLGVKSFSFSKKGDVPLNK